MYDLDFLLNPPKSITSPIIYFYGFGDLRLQMQLSLEAVAAPDHLFPVAPMYLRFGNGLFGGVPFSDTRDHLRTHSLQKRRAAIRSLIAGQKPAILFVRGNYDGDLRAEIPSNCLVIEECLIDRNSIAKAVELLATTTDLLSDCQSLAIAAINDYFEEFVEHTRFPSFADVRHEFERVVLLFVDQVTGAFSSEQASRDLKARSFIARPLQRLVLHREEQAISELMRGLENRYSTASSARHLRELLAQTQALVQSTFADRVPTDIDLIRVTVWSCVLLAALKYDDLDSTGTAIVDQVARNYLIRSDNRLLSKPLNGIWGSLQQPSPMFGGDISLRNELLTGLISVQRYSFTWLSRLKSCLQVSLDEEGTSASGSSTPYQSTVASTFAKIIGQESAKAALQRRCLSGEHTLPLVLWGPDGVGKRFLAQVYARASICEQVNELTAEPCGLCKWCEWYDAGAILHELDARVPDAIRHVDEVVLNITTMGTVWGRQVVVVDNASDNIPLLDMCMKTLESRSQWMTFIFLVDKLENLSPACRSRCEVHRLTPLTMAQMDKLEDAHDGAVKNAPVRLLLRAMSVGLPGTFHSNLQKIRQNGVSNLEEALQVLRLDWGSETCIQLAMVIRNAVEGGDRSFEHDRPVQAVQNFQSVMAAIYEHHHGRPISEPALLHLTGAIYELDTLVQRAAGEMGAGFLDLWNDISNHLCTSDPHEAELSLSDLIGYIRQCIPHHAS